MKRKVYLAIGILILLILVVSYFINITYSRNDSVTDTELLGVIIFFNPFILAGYILIAIMFIVSGVRKKNG